MAINFVFDCQNRKRKKGKHLLSHRYNLLPLLRSHPGGVQRELIVKDLPGTKVINAPVLQKRNSCFLIYFFILLVYRRLFAVKSTTFAI